MEAAPDKKSAMREGMDRYAKAVDTFWSGEAAKGELPDEATLLRGRREAMGQPTAGRTEALALSGGGIRSATFSLGVLQALAGRRRDAGSVEPPRSFKESMLSRFDYLSTVSGGGFIGAFLVGLFVPGRLRKEASSAEKAANDAQAVLGSGPPGRIRAAECRDEHLRLRAPLAWLRENGRYLTPTGTGDLVYAAGLGLRNWVSLHVVIGVALLLALTLMAVLRSALLDQPWAEALCRLEARWLNEALAGARFSKEPADSIWWSTLFVAALAPLVLWVLPMGIAFWTTSRTPEGLSRPINRSAVSMAAAAGVFFWLGHHGTGGSTLLQWIWWAVAGVTALGVLAHVVLACFQPLARLQTVQLTRGLASGLIIAGALVLLAVIETLGHTLYLLTVTGPAWLPSVPAALGAALAWLGKKIGASGSAGSLPGWMQKMPLTTLGGIAGLAALLLIATLWAWVVQWLAWQGEAPGMAQMVSREHLVLLLTHAAAWLVLAVGVGQFPAFINLSSLQSFYAARLIRTYLGVSNGERFTGDASRLSAAEPMAGDNLAFETLYQPGRDGAKARLKTWAPLHLVNVTVNKTVDPAEQLVQRDRKGQPMAVMPYGFAIDGWRNLFKPVGGFAPPNPPMHLGEWVGTSGAAFSTGIGRETTLGMSLLMGAANVRLGVWWASGQDHKEPLTWRNRLGRWMGAMFRTQTYLSYEFTARFHGLRRRWQYLSDGGHFENTALYELLRRERNVGLIVASDNGADPAYRFDDLANLIRLARIDLRVDVGVVSDFGGWEHLPKVFGSTGQFAADGGKTNPAALLLKVRPLDDEAAAPSWIVLLKPSPQAGAPADVLQYAKTHPAFPQEPTSDQFFDEAQWESYRGLGEYIAGRVLAPAAWAELQRFMAGEAPPAVSPPP
ncbi:patatin-like phospholipase family protein [Roseateles asaccharophilus]|uniref:PNPLA domain-containing protein n=1 Tax=Roseateles asaccharophilus TaxID=582607 RepID=A0ABU2A7P5_9BURK|nr:patatin-like phospholipase family protein [Roseateles asaccharophilus]MDR7333189.1 hypothetical protein [Roseateles asaccharophilus]